MMDSPLKREVDAWIESAKMAHEVGDEEASQQTLMNAGRLLLDAARRNARPFTDALWEVMTSDQPSDTDGPRP